MWINGHPLHTNESNSYLKVYTDSFNELTEAQNRLVQILKSFQMKIKKY